MFNSRWPLLGDPCDDPHVFFLETVESSRGNLIVSTYARSSPRGLPTCFFSGNYSADQISKVRVLSPATKLIQIDRSECCDVVQAGDSNITEVKYRTCKVDEIIG
ncbi:hypothetical protein RHSIM_Rhsim13G0218400 [Rhododendron simsii]|uniref:Uncharacterized protein n=1 Tax=Rhododendron simsii TaxID=118357 RepID=A0A834G1C9_RHOSS|nr:hypothetical protein RHSIM_Rhsim13G0218400 [Rhododendron simsii]